MKRVVAREREQASERQCVRETERVRENLKEGERDSESEEVREEKDSKSFGFRVSGLGRERGEDRKRHEPPDHRPSPHPPPWPAQAQTVTRGHPRGRLGRWGFFSSTHRCMSRRT